MERTAAPRGRLFCLLAGHEGLREAMIAAATALAVEHAQLGM
jgi:hypothetical protein